MRKLAHTKTKMQISCAVASQLISTFVFCYTNSFFLKAKISSFWRDALAAQASLCQTLITHDSFVLFLSEENIVMEYLEGGSLFHYVTKNKNIPQEMFIRISLDIARVTNERQ